MHRFPLRKTVLKTLQARQIPGRLATMATTSDNPEDLISALPLVRRLRASPDTHREYRLHSDLEPTTAFPSHMVSGSLYGKDKLPVHPRLFVPSSSSLLSSPSSPIITVGYTGSRICGHPGFVHGGVAFALFDDVFARASALVLESGIAVTASLKVDFRRPSLTDRVFVLRTTITRREGRKVWLTGQLRSLAAFSAAEMADRELPDGGQEVINNISAEEEEDAGADLVAEAESLFVEPTFAGTMESWLKF